MPERPSRTASSSAGPEYSRNLNPVPSSMVSSRPPGRADHRDGAVPQAVDLVEAARLIAAGHQEHIAAGLDAVRQRVVEADVDRRPVPDIRLPRCGIDPRIPARPSPALPDKCPPNQDLSGHLGDQIGTLLPAKAGHDSDQRPVHGGGRLSPFRTEAAPCKSAFQLRSSTTEVRGNKRVAHRDSIPRNRRRSGFR